MRLIAIIRQPPAGAQAGFDRSAIEAALRIKAARLETRADTHITAVCLGDEQAVKLLREAAGMGCDSALLIKRAPPAGAQAGYLEPSRCAAILAEALRSLKWDAVITSCYAIDPDTIPAGFLLAELLALPEAGYAEEITPQADGSFLLKRRFENDFQLLQLHTPCLISALPKPGRRIYMTASGITRAYAMDIPVLEVSEPEQPPHLILHSSQKKQERRRGRILTVPADQAVSAIMDALIQHHILSYAAKTDTGKSAADSCRKDESKTAAYPQEEIL